MNQTVRAYIEKQPPSLQEMLVRIREIFFDTLPNCEEKLGWGVIVFGKDKFYMAVIKDRVHIGFAITGLSKEEIAVFEGSGKTMRHIKIHSMDEIDEEQIKKLIRLVDEKAVCVSK